MQVHAEGSLTGNFQMCSEPGTYAGKKRSEILVHGGSMMSSYLTFDVDPAKGIVLRHFHGRTGLAAEKTDAVLARF